RMSGVLTDYERVLRQRSALLKSAGAAARGGRGADLRTLDVWDAKLAQAGAQIVVARRRLVAALGPHVSGSYETVSAGQGEARITYRSSLGAEGGPGGAAGAEGAAGAGGPAASAASDGGLGGPGRAGSSVDSTRDQ